MCAIFGVFNVKDAARLTAVGLHNNQHRAIDYAGMVSVQSGIFYEYREAGIARQVFTEAVLQKLKGLSALGHLRYPTVTDNVRLQKIQPITGTYKGLRIAIAHNGNLTNVDELRKLVPSALFITSMDTECIMRLLELKSDTEGDIETHLADVLNQVQGSYALCLLMNDKMIVARDPQGNRPLSIASMRGVKGGYCISSETCAFAALETDASVDVNPGTMLSITASSVVEHRFANADEKKCRFEALYFASPASVVFEESVVQFRFSLGQALGTYCPVPNGFDIVTPVPDSANFIALGYAQTANSGMHYPVIYRSHYVGRSFIIATQLLRDAAVAQKFLFAADQIYGRKIVVVDDSIVRGTTFRKIIAKLRRLGAAEIHVRIASPPIKHSCIYGINTPTTDELISANCSKRDICKIIEADSLEFLPLWALKQLSVKHKQFCYACMDGKYW